MPEHVLIGRYPHMTRESIPHTTDLTENVSSLFFFFKDGAQFSKCLVLILGHYS